MAEPDDDQNKRKRRLMWLALLGAPMLVASSVGIVVASQSSSDLAPAATSQVEPREEPRIQAGGVGDSDETLSQTPPSDLLDTISAEDDDQIEPLWPVQPIRWEPATPTVIPNAPDATADPPAPTSPTPDSSTPPVAPSPGPVPSTPTPPSTDPDAEPNPGDDPTPQPDPSPTEEPTPAPGGEPVPDETETPTPGSPEPPATGGESEVRPQGLPMAIREAGYRMLMHVTGDFDLTNATWALSEGELPAGLEIDADTGTISGVTTAETGRYIFQLTVANEKAIVRGWFLIVVVPSENSTPAPEPGDGSDSEFPPGGGVTPEEPSIPTPGDGSGAGPETPAPGDDTAPTDPVEPTDPTAPVDPSGPENPSPGTGEGGEPEPTPTDPAEPGDPTVPTDPGAGDPSDGEVEPGDPSQPGDGTPAEPEDGTEVEPEDPTIDPGAGGSMPDQLTFSVPASITVQVGTSLDMDLAATSSLGLEITYDATGLPTWLKFDRGMLSGNAPTAQGSFTAMLTASNAKNSETKRVTVIVAPNDIELDVQPITLMEGESTSIELAARNGASNSQFVYSLVRAVPGVSLEGSTLTAAAGVAGSYVIEILAHDLNAPVGGRGSFTIPFEVTPKPIVFDSTSHAMTQYRPYSAELTASQGWGAYAYRVVEGALPVGVELKGSTLAGTPSRVGTYPITVEVTDRKGLAARAVVSIDVQPNPAITPSGAIDLARPSGLAVSPDGKTLFASTSTLLYAIDVATNTVTQQAPKASGSSLSGKLSADGSRLALVGSSMIQVFDTSTLEKVGEYRAKDILDASWSADGSKLYAARTLFSSAAEFFVIDTTTWASGSTLRLNTSGGYWKLQTLPSGLVLANSSGSTSTLEINPSDMTARSFYTKRAATRMAAGTDGTVWMAQSSLVQRVNVDTGVLMSSANLGQSVAVSDLALSPDGRWLYVLTYGAIVVMDTEDASEIARVPVDSMQSAMVTVSPDGTKVYVTSDTKITVLTPAID